jgi:hypothetical protein
VRARLFKQSALDTECKVEFLDVPGLHCYGEEVSDAFFDELADTNQHSLFEKKSI